MKAIYKREVRAYFKGLIGPVFIALFLAAAGVYTAYLNLVNRIPSFELSLYNMSIVFLIAIPPAHHALLCAGTAAEHR